MCRNLEAHRDMQRWVNPEWFWKSGSAQIQKSQRSFLVVLVSHEFDKNLQVFIFSFNNFNQMEENSRNDQRTGAELKSRKTETFRTRPTKTELSECLLAFVWLDRSSRHLLLVTIRMLFWTNRKWFRPATVWTSWTELLEKNFCSCCAVGGAFTDRIAAFQSNGADVINVQPSVDWTVLQHGEDWLSGSCDEPSSGYPLNWPGSMSHVLKSPRSERTPFS